MIKEQELWDNFRENVRDLMDFLVEGDDWTIRELEDRASDLIFNIIKTTVKNYARQHPKVSI